MNTFTKSEIKEIESRIKSRICPYCGGNLNIEITHDNIIVGYKVISFCCEKFYNDALKIVSEERNNKINKNINNMLNM